MLHIDYANAYNTAVHIVGEYGEDYCLGPEGCTYVTRVERVDAIQNPRAAGLMSVCIVGKILEAIGVPLEDMEGMGILTQYRHRFQDMGIIFTDKAYYFLDSAQSMQDGDLPWGLSVRHAERLTSRREWAEDEGLIAL